MPTTDVQPRTCAACGETFYISTEIPETHEVAQFCPECSQIINNENILPMMIGGVPLVEEEDLTRDKEGEKEDDEYGEREQEEEDIYKEDHDPLLADAEEDEGEDDDFSDDDDDDDDDDEDDL